MSDAIGAREFTPAYLALLADGELERRVERGRDYLKNCVLCGRHCKIDRLETTRGSICRVGELARVASYGPHHGEEAPLRGNRGSGTIFISSCNLLCVYCQNADISQQGIGRDVTPREMAAMMLELQAFGCHNINFVSPSHVVAQILNAVLLAARDGLRTPLVYNTGGYDSPEALELLDGVIDIYMPDMKYGDSLTAHQFSQVRHYVEVNRAAVREMHRQVGDLQLDERGVALRGLLVRHLVLPGGLAGSGRVLEFIADEISRDTYVNLMDQYRPCYRADDYPPLDRRLDAAEYRRALALAERYGLRRLANHPNRFC
jgi:putative pyruvate formate lyase activating enzyme